MTRALPLIVAWIVLALAACVDNQSPSGTLPGDRPTRVADGGADTGEGGAADASDDRAADAIVDAPVDAAEEDANDF